MLKLADLLPDAIVFYSLLIELSLKRVDYCFSLLLAFDLTLKELNFLILDLKALLEY